MSRPISLPSGANRVLTTNAVTTTYPSTADTTTSPAGNAGVFQAEGYAQVLLTLFGAGVDDEDFEFKVMGWYDGSASWYTHELFVGDAVVCSQTGTSGGIVSGSELYVDTITRVRGIAPYWIGTQTAEQKTALSVQTMGADLIQVMFDINGVATPITSANATYVLL